MPPHTCAHEYCDNKTNPSTEIAFEGQIYCSKACARVEANDDEQTRVCASPRCDKELRERTAEIANENAMVCNGICKQDWFNERSEERECEACGDAYKVHPNSSDRTCDDCSKAGISVEVECSYDYCDNTETMPMPKRDRMQSNGKDWYCYSIHKQQDKQNIKPVECQYHGCSEHFPVKMETDEHENFDKDHGTYKKHALHENSWKPDPDDKRERFQRHADGEVTEPMPDREMYCTQHLRKRLHQRGRAIEWEKEPDVLVEEQKRSGTPV